jgi:hypothetical protein
MPLRKITAILAAGRQLRSVGAPGLTVPRYEVSLTRDGQAPFGDSATIVRVGVVTQAVLTVADPGPAGTKWTVAVRAVSQYGIVGPAAAVLLKLVSDGTDLVVRPNSPVIQEVRPLADGAIEVRWQHDDAYAGVAAATFEIFAGSGTIDYGTPAATAGRYDRRAVLTGLEADVPHKVVVRAVSAADVHDGNTAARVVVPRNAPPPGLASGALAVEQS